jgi:hypothetical protein
MRQTNRDIQIHSLLRKKIREPKPRLSTKLKTVTIPHDPKHTQFIVSVDRDNNEVINGYLRRRKY